MENKNLYLPGFHLQTLRRRPRSRCKILADERARVRDHSLMRLGECFGRFIPPSRIDQDSSGAFSRRRLWSKTNTFWAFFSQVLSADGGCREVVRKLQAHASAKGMAVPSSSTSAYCQARQKLDTDTLEAVLSSTSEQLQDRGAGRRWKQRRVVVVDGTGVSMPDTPENQEVWPQPGNQEPGCGFPQARACACFCLSTGALLSHRVGSRKQHELPLLRQQWGSFAPGDVMLGDKGFCSYYDVWQFQQRGVDCVMTLARRTPVDRADSVAVLGNDDLLIVWPKPKWNSRLSYTRQEWEQLPQTLTLRQIKVTIDEPGFRTTGYHLVTTLTDSTVYTAADLAALYYQRWDVELNFRDLKATLGMDILRGLTPTMVRKEILMHLIVYNAIRLMMLHAANDHDVPLRRLSFKASMQALRHWEPQLSQAALKPADRRRLLHSMRQSIAQAIVPERPGRREPRCLKRRPKPFALLTTRREKMREIPHRGRYRAKVA